MVRSLGFLTEKYIYICIKETMQPNKEENPESYSEFKLLFSKPTKLNKSKRLLDII